MEAIMYISRADEACQSYPAIFWGLWMRGIFRLGALAAAVFAIGTSVAQAAAVFTFSQQGSDVVGVLSGTLSLKNADFVAKTASYDPSIYSATAQLNASTTQCCALTAAIYSASGPSSFGNGSVFLGTATGSSLFELKDDSITLPVNYSGEALDNTLTLANETIAGLGITPGSYVYTLAGSGDTVTLLFSAAPGVPEPATWGMMLLGFFGLGAMVRRRSVALAT